MKKACTKPGNSKAAALLITLAFLVLLSVMVIAYLGRATADKSAATASYGDAVADMLARSALDIIVADFKQEIVNGSSAIPTGSSPSTYYSPSPEQNVVPQRNVAASAGIPNLIRTSLYPDSLTLPAVKSRASAVNSTANPSLNGRQITSSRWNKHCLIPMGNPTAADVDPSPTPTFSPPDWVYVTAQGPISAPSPAAVVGRYAYAVYDEGGLLDINIAGCPSPTPAGSPVGRKGVITFADTRALPYRCSAQTGIPPASSATFTGIGQIVAWRDNATVQAVPASSFPSWQPVTSIGAAAFVTQYLSPSWDFMSRAASAYVTGIQPFNSVTMSVDQQFVTRGELLNFNRFQGTAGFDSNTLGHVGTFSRDRNAPTFWLPQVQTKTGISNVKPLPARFPVTGWLIHNDSTNAAQVKQKFGLYWDEPSQHFRYITAQGSTAGPSADTIPPPASGSDDDFFQILSYARSTATHTPDIGETLSIGAAIIDEFDSDPITMQIEYTNPSTGATTIAYGMEMADSTRPSGSPTPAPTPPAGYVMIPEPTNAWDSKYRNVGEFGYAYVSSNSNGTLDFHSNSPANFDSGILDLFAFNIASPRAGLVNLNTRNAAVLSAILRAAWISTSTSSGISSNTAATVAAGIVAQTTARPAIGRHDIPRISAASGVGSAIGSSEEAQETIVRALAEITTARTWGLFIDVIAQSGHCKRGTQNLAEFVVEGEKRYWLHIAIDRFYGDTIDQQLEAVYE